MNNRLVSFNEDRPRTGLPEPVDSRIQDLLSDLPWIKRTLNANDDLRLLPSGMYGVASTTVTEAIGLPTKTWGNLEVSPLNASDTSRRILMWRAVKNGDRGPVEVWACTRVSDTKLTPWVRVDAGGMNAYHRGVIRGGEDANDYRTPDNAGQWLTEVNVANIPSTSSLGVLECMAMASTCVQRFTAYASGETWLRFFQGTTPYSWRRIDAGGVEVEAGDTIFRGLIPSDKTPDDYLKAEDLGWWHIDHDDSRIGTPFTERAAMEVLSIGSRRIQRVTEFSGRVWVRQGSPSSIGAWVRVDAAANAYFRGAVRSGEDVGDYRLPKYAGQWRVEAGVLGLPTTASLGVLENLAMLNSCVQRFTKYPDGETFVRTFIGGATPTPWKQIYPALTPEEPVITTASGTKASGFKRIPLAVTLGRGTSVTAPLAQEVRYCIHYNAPITRWRLHVAARDSRSGNTVTGNVTFGGWTLGEEGAGGAYINPETVLEGFSTDGQGWTSDWINTPIPQDVPLLLGTSYSADAAPYTQVGACWMGASEATLTQRQVAPFEVWIEAETYATTPVIAVLGSSSDTGVGGSRPVVDSTIGRYARAHHALPVHYANSGDSMSGSRNPNAYKWTRWQDCDRPDAVLWALGSNDVHGGNTLAQMQTHHAEVAEILRDKVTDVFYGATVFQRATGEHPDRVPYNNWLKTLPNGLRDVFDFSAAIGSPPDPSFDADGVHINDAGHNAILGALTRPIVAPAPVYQA